MKDDNAGVAIKEFVQLYPKMYSFLVDDNNEHKKAKGVNRNVVATISRNKYKEMYCWIINLQDTQWIELKVKTIE